MKIVKKSCTYHNSVTTINIFLILYRNAYQGKMTRVAYNCGYSPFQSYGLLVVLFLILLLLVQPITLYLFGISS